MMEKANGIFTGLIAAFYSSDFGFAVDPLAGAITSGRARSLVALAVGLISVIIGAFARARSAGRGAPIVALVLGLICIVLSVVHLGMSTGGLGTGSGRAGAIVALVLGLIGMGLGGLALGRSQRTNL